MKYIIYPGLVESKSDGDLHYISVSKLMSLYGVDRKDCKIAVDCNELNRLIRLNPDAQVLTALRSGEYVIKDNHEK